MVKNVGIMDKIVQHIFKCLATARAYHYKALVWRSSGQSSVVCL